MKNNKGSKTFDAIKVMRQIRDKLSLEIMDMSFEDERTYLEKLLCEGNEKQTANAYHKRSSD
jgi:hypothetical protein